MTLTVEYKITRLLDAPRELVWAAWTEPELFSRWFSARRMATPIGRITLDAWPGGVWRATLTGDEGFEVTFDGTYREVRKPVRLVFTTGDPDSPGEGPASVVTIDFADVDGKTEMRFHQHGVNVDPAGWMEFFDRLAEHFTTASARPPA
ncbi:SRPBCC domain-containing protein [Nonomuraea turkmeniaca]|uniref:SRPBCC domain-containing protein n=1 Tax=Nonomuraea turkmeniaca TaxID=103838 RepID=A0A5S4FTD5_9ACTN|nr:SRPBCC domain-containing protein [Nonomuraea turkmeniaca]TMR24025.1 SRPBCC domain-containing protein [Nonomuraea turkmeniaca]